MRNFLIGYLRLVLATTALVAGIVAVVLALPLWWQRWDFLEPLLGLLGTAAAVPGLYFALLPRMAAVQFHNGTRWLQRAPLWSPRSPDELAMKASVGAILGRFAKDGEATIPVTPKPLHTEVKWFGGQRGVYRVYAVQLHTDQEGWEWGDTAPLPAFQPEPTHPPLGW